MLVELRVQNFAIIDSLHIDFEGGLNTFTGETGAGKSIIIDAVETLLGGRAETSMVRTGTEEAIITGTFLIPQVSRDSIHSILNQEALLEENEHITLEREIRSNGRNSARINGHTANTSLVRQIGELLVDIHGQSEHLSLLRESTHINLLDRYVDSVSQNQLSPMLTLYQGYFHQLKMADRNLQELLISEKDAARLSDLLSYQIKEIEIARLNHDEETSLLEERNRLTNAETLAKLTQDALQAIDEGTPESSAAIDLLGLASRSIQELSRLDASQIHMMDIATTIFDNTTELTKSLRNYLEDIEFTPHRLDQVEQRLSVIDNLKRKYGDTIEAVLNFAANAKIQLEQIENAEERIRELEAEITELKIQLSKTGQEVSDIRHKFANLLEKAVGYELQDLRMKGASLQVMFKQLDNSNGIEIKDGRTVAYYPSGLEQIEFLIETNPGEGYKPLVKIASGGETSRLMLALKYVLSRADYVPTLIFDEIDQGIGGRVGGIVGKKLAELGSEHQVLCVTHLPQLAAFGNKHFHIGKEVESGRTLTRVRVLNRQERISELAQMMGTLSRSTLQSAEELLNAAQ